MKTESSRFRLLFDTSGTYREMFGQLNETYMSVMEELTASVCPKGVIKLKMTLSHDVELDEIIVGWECSGDVPKKKDGHERLRQPERAGADQHGR